MAGELGHKVKRGYGLRYQIYVPEEDQARFSRAVELYGGSLSALIRELIRAYVGEDDDNEPRG